MSKIGYEDSALTLPEISGTPLTLANHWKVYATDAQQLIALDGSGQKRLLFAATASSAPSTPHTVSIFDQVILCNKSGEAAPFTVNLPTGATHTLGSVTIKDKKGNAGTYPITVNADGAETIDGASNYVIDVDRASITLVFEGTEWSVI